MKIKTPIDDFVRDYAAGDPLRLHMPGHKGAGELERFDITEIDGADSLYEANGIIRESEETASALFGCPTFYSAEGSSLCIRAMLYLVTIAAGEERPLVLAARNVHRSFVYAAALLDIDVRWLMGEDTSYLSCRPTPRELECELAAAEREGCRPAAVYITSPDYLGYVADVGGLAEVCRSRRIPLLVDNAHGAYFGFCQNTAHPITLGAALACDSAHKTLPVLTGGAYLHISPDAPSEYSENARRAMALFGSTSPSYLILRSLDLANARLGADLPQKISDAATRLAAMRARLEEIGMVTVGDEPLKLTLLTKKWGYTGGEVAAYLGKFGIVPEFYDDDHLVMMPAPDNGDDVTNRIYSALSDMPRREEITVSPPHPERGKAVMSLRRALFAPCERVRTDEAVGRVLSDPGVSCPPAVPIAVPGEVIDSAAVCAFKYYKYGECIVVKE